MQSMIQRSRVFRVWFFISAQSYYLQKAAFESWFIRSSDFDAMAWLPFITEQKEEWLLVFLSA